MRLDKLAVTAQEAFQNAMGVAGEADAAVIEPIHLLKALLDSDENNLAAIVKRIGADPVWLSQNVADEIAKMPKQTGATPMAIPGQDLIKVIDNSVKIAEKLGDSYATSEHLLIALSEDKGAAGRILTTAGVTRKNIEAAYESLRGDTRATSQTDKTQFEALEQYGQNLTQQLCKLGGVLGLLKGIALPRLGDLGVALAVGNAAHGQIHTDLAALAVEVLAQTLLDLLGNILGDADNMLGHIGVILLLNELGCRGLADRAELGDGTLSDITTNGANILSHKNCLLLFCNCS